MRRPLFRFDLFAFLASLRLSQTSDMPHEQIKTRRLALRALDASDAPRIAVLAGVWEVASMTGRIPYPYSSVDALHWVTELADGEIVYGITLNGALIGICGYTPDGTGAAEVGYWIGQDYWGKGYATEAVRELIGHGFRRGGIHRFTCSHFTENKGSQRVIAKLGFRLLGLSSGWCAARGMELPTLRYERRRPLSARLKAFAS